MFRRLWLCLGLVFMMTGGAFAFGHESGSAPDRGLLGYLQHRVADATGIGWFHPAMPMPSHGEHVAWEMVRSDVMAMALAYDQHDRVALLRADVVRYGALFEATPSMENQHRMDEATAALAQMLAWAGRGDPQVTSLLGRVDGTLLINGSGDLCGSEGILLADARNHVDSADTQNSNPELLRMLMLAGLLAALMTAPLMLRRRRVRA